MGRGGQVRRHQAGMIWLTASANRGVAEAARDGTVACAPETRVQAAMLEWATPPEAAAFLKTAACDLLFLRLMTEQPMLVTFRIRSCNSTIPCWYRPALECASLWTQISLGYASRLCAITPLP